MHATKFCSMIQKTLFGCRQGAFSRDEDAVELYKMRKMQVNNVLFSIKIYI